MHQEQQQPWYENISIKKANRVFMRIGLPYLLLSGTLDRLTAISHLELFAEFELVALLGFIVVDFVAVGLWIKGFRQIAREKWAIR